MAEGGESVPASSDQPQMYEDTTDRSVILSPTDSGQSENTVNPVRRGRIPSEINQEALQQALAEYTLASISDELHPALAEYTLLSSSDGAPSKITELHVTNLIGKVDISRGTSDGDVPDMVIERLTSAKDIFVTTDSYHDVCGALDYHGHVLISGSPGSGKTTMALYIMGTYRKKKYRVKFVDDVTGFKIEDYVSLSTPSLLVLDDVFGKFAPTPEIKLRCTSMFSYLETHFKLLDRKMEREDTDKHTDVEVSGNLKIIMCSRTNITNHPFVSSLLQKYTTSLFRVSSINDLTGRELKDCVKESILRKHLTKPNINLTQADIKRISQLKYQTLGFPYICQLFVDSRCSKDKAVQFFHEPWEYLLRLIRDIFSDDDPNYRAAVLLLMVLNEGTLDLIHLLRVEKRTDSGLYRRLKSVQGILPNTFHPESLVKAAKQEMCTLVVSDKMHITFSHPTVCDVVSFVVGERNPVFILENCSLNFIIERTRVSEDCRTEASSSRDVHSFIIYLNQETAILLIERLAREINDGHIALPLSHQCLISGSMVDCLFSELSKYDNFERCLHSHDTGYGLGFLYWSSFAGTSPVTKYLFQHTLFEVSEILEGYLGCCVSGNDSSLQALAAKSEFCFDQIATANIGNILSKRKEPKQFVRSLSTVCSPTKTVLDPETVTPRMHGDNKDMLIHVAAANGFTGVVEILLDRVGTPIDAKGGNGMTALMYSSYRGHSDLTELLIKRGADLEMLDEEDDNCLHLTCRGGSADIAKSLIAVNMDINKRGEHGRTPLMYASYNGHEDIVKLLLEKGALPNPDVSSIDPKDNCLHLACVKGEMRIVQILLDQAKVDIESRGERARTALMYACRHGQLETAKELLARRANINVLDETGFSCLHLAAMKGHVPTAEWLLSVCQKVDVDCTNKTGRTPLMYAMRHGHADMVHLLIAQGSDISVKDHSMVSCLHMAVQSGRLPLIKLCLDKGQDINIHGPKNRSAVMTACFYGYTDVVEYLQSKGADILQRDEFGQTCLHVACRSGHIEIAERLLQTFRIDEKDNNGMTPFMHAAKANYFDMVDFLVNRGADMNVQNNRGQTSLHTSAAFGNAAWCAKLLDLGMHVDIHDSAKRTPLMCASKSRDDRSQVVNILLERGADINVRNEKGNTCLHIAAESGHVATLECLLDSGLDINTRGSHDYTPIMSACRCGSKDQFDLLLSKGADLHILTDHAASCLHLVCMSDTNDTHILNELLDHGLNIDQEDDDNMTPVMYAISKGSLDVLNVLLCRCGSVKALDISGTKTSLLHYAYDIKDISVEKSKLLLEWDPKVNAQNQNGVTPLMCAARQGNWAVVDLLINSGANLNTTDLSGNNCISYAEDHGHYDLAYYLSKK